MKTKKKLDGTAKIVRKLTATKIPSDFAKQLKTEKPAMSLELEIMEIRKEISELRRKISKLERGLESRPRSPHDIIFR